eukprot:g7115.t1
MSSIAQDGRLTEIRVTLRYDYSRKRDVREGAVAQAGSLPDGKRDVSAIPDKIVLQATSATEQDKADGNGAEEAVAEAIETPNAVAGKVAKPKQEHEAGTTGGDLTGRNAGSPLELVRTLSVSGTGKASKPRPFGKSVWVDDSKSTRPASQDPSTFPSLGESLKHTASTAGPASTKTQTVGGGTDKKMGPTETDATQGPPSGGQAQDSGSFAGQRVSGPRSVFQPSGRTSRTRQLLSSTSSLPEVGPDTINAIIKDFEPQKAFAGSFVSGQNETTASIYGPTLSVAPSPGAVPTAAPEPVPSQVFSAVAQPVSGTAEQAQGAARHVDVLVGDAMKFPPGSTNSGAVLKQAVVAGGPGGTSSSTAAPAPKMIVQSSTRAPEIPDAGPARTESVYEGLGLDSLATHPTLTGEAPNKYVRSRLPAVFQEEQLSQFLAPVLKQLDSNPGATLRQVLPAVGMKKLHLKRLDRNLTAVLNSAEYRCSVECLLAKTKTKEYVGQAEKFIAGFHDQGAADEKKDDRSFFFRLFVTTREGDAERERVVREFCDALGFKPLERKRVEAELGELGAEISRTAERRGFIKDLNAAPPSAGVVRMGAVATMDDDATRFDLKDILSDAWEYAAEPQSAESAFSCSDSTQHDFGGATFGSDPHFSGVGGASRHGALGAIPEKESESSSSDGGSSDSESSADQSPGSTSPPVQAAFGLPLRMKHARNPLDRGRAWGGVADIKNGASMKMDATSAPSDHALGSGGGFRGLPAQHEDASDQYYPSGAKKHSPDDDSSDHGGAGALSLKHMKGAALLYAGKDANAFFNGADSSENENEIANQLEADWNGAEDTQNKVHVPLHDQIMQREGALLLDPEAMQKVYSFRALFERKEEELKSEQLDELHGGDVGLPALNAAGESAPSSGDTSLSSGRFPCDLPSTTSSGLASQLEGERNLYRNTLDADLQPQNVHEESVEDSASSLNEEQSSEGDDSDDSGCGGLITKKSVTVRAGARGGASSPRFQGAGGVASLRTKLVGNKGVKGGKGSSTSSSAVRGLGGAGYIKGGYTDVANPDDPADARLLSYISQHHVPADHLFQPAPRPLYINDLGAEPTGGTPRGGPLGSNKAGTGGGPESTEEVKEILRASQQLQHNLPTGSRSPEHGPEAGRGGRSSRRGSIDVGPVLGVQQTSAASPSLFNNSELLEGAHPPSQEDALAGVESTSREKEKHHHHHHRRRGSHQIDRHAEKQLFGDAEEKLREQIPALQGNPGIDYFGAGGIPGLFNYGVMSPEISQASGSPGPWATATSTTTTMSGGGRAAAAATNGGSSDVGAASTAGKGPGPPSSSGLYPCYPALPGAIIAHGAPGNGRELMNMGGKGSHQGHGQYYHQVVPRGRGDSLWSASSCSTSSSRASVSYPVLPASASSRGAFGSNLHANLNLRAPTEAAASGPTPTSIGSGGLYPVEGKASRVAVLAGKALSCWSADWSAEVRILEVPGEDANYRSTQIWWESCPLQRPNAAKNGFFTPLTSAKRAELHRAMEHVEAVTLKIKQAEKAKINRKDTVKNRGVLEAAMEKVEALAEEFEEQKDHVLHELEQQHQPHSGGDEEKEYVDFSLMAPAAAGPAPSSSVCFDDPCYVNYMVDEQDHEVEAHLSVCSLTEASSALRRALSSLTNLGLSPTEEQKQLQSDLMRVAVLQRQQERAQKLQDDVRLAIDEEFVPWLADSYEKLVTVEECLRALERATVDSVVGVLQRDAQMASLSSQITAALLQQCQFASQFSPTSSPLDELCRALQLKPLQAKRFKKLHTTTTTCTAPSNIGTHVVDVVDAANPEQEHDHEQAPDCISWGLFSPLHCVKPPLPVRPEQAQNSSSEEKTFTALIRRLEKLRPDANALGNAATEFLSAEIEKKTQLVRDAVRTNLCLAFLQADHYVRKESMFRSGTSGGREENDMPVVHKNDVPGPVGFLDKLANMNPCDYAKHQRAAISDLQAALRFQETPAFPLVEAIVLNLGVLARSMLQTSVHASYEHEEFHGCKCNTAREFAASVHDDLQQLSVARAAAADGLQFLRSRIIRNTRPLGGDNEGAEADHRRVLLLEPLEREAQRTERATAAVQLRMELQARRAIASLDAERAPPRAFPQDENIIEGQFTAGAGRASLSTSAADHRAASLFDVPEAWRDEFLEGSLSGFARKLFGGVLVTNSSCSRNVDEEPSLARICDLDLAEGHAHANTPFTSTEQAWLRAQRHVLRKTTRTLKRCLTQKDICAHKSQDSSGVDADAKYFRNLQDHAATTPIFSGRKFRRRKCTSNAGSRWSTETNAKTAFYYAWPNVRRRLLKVSPCDVVSVDAPAAEPAELPSNEIVAGTFFADMLLYDVRRVNEHEAVGGSLCQRKSARCRYLLSDEDHEIEEVEDEPDIVDATCYAGVFLEEILGERIRARKSRNSQRPPSASAFEQQQEDALLLQKAKEFEDLLDGLPARAASACSSQSRSPDMDNVYQNSLTTCVCDHDIKRWRRDEKYEFGSTTGECSSISTPRVLAEADPPQPSTIASSPASELLGPAEAAHRRLQDRVTRTFALLAVLREEVRGQHAENSLSVLARLRRRASNVEEQEDEVQLQHQQVQAVDKKMKRDRLFMEEFLAFALRHKYGNWLLERTEYLHQRRFHAVLVATEFARCLNPANAAGEDKNGIRKQQKHFRQLFDLHLMLFPSPLFNSKRKLVRRDESTYSVEEQEQVNDAEDDDETVWSTDFLLPANREKSEVEHHGSRSISVASSHFSAQEEIKPEETASHSGTSGDSTQCIDMKLPYSSLSDFCPDLLVILDHASTTGDNQHYGNNTTADCNWEKQVRALRTQIQKCEAVCEEHCRNVLSGNVKRVWQWVEHNLFAKTLRADADPTTTLSQEDLDWMTDLQQRRLWLRNPNLSHEDGDNSNDAGCDLRLQNTDLHPLYDTMPRLPSALERVFVWLVMDHACSERRSVEQKLTRALACVRAFVPAHSTPTRACCAAQRGQESDEPLPLPGTGASSRRSGEVRSSATALLPAAEDGVGVGLGGPEATGGEGGAPGADSGVDWAISQARCSPELQETDTRAGEVAKPVSASSDDIENHDGRAASKKRYLQRSIDMNETDRSAVASLNSPPRVTEGSSARAGLADALATLEKVVHMANKHILADLPHGAEIMRELEQIARNFQAKINFGTAPLAKALEHICGQLKSARLLPTDHTALEEARWYLSEVSTEGKCNWNCDRDGGTAGSAVFAEDCDAQEVVSVNCDGLLAEAVRKATVPALTQALKIANEIAEIACQDSSGTTGSLAPAAIMANAKNQVRPSRNRSEQYKQAEKLRDELLEKQRRAEDRLKEEGILFRPVKTGLARRSFLRVPSAQSPAGTRTGPSLQVEATWWGIVIRSVDSINADILTPGDTIVSIGSSLLYGVCGTAESLSTAQAVFEEHFFDMVPIIVYPGGSIEGKIPPSYVEKIDHSNFHDDLQDFADNYQVSASVETRRGAGESYGGVGASVAPVAPVADGVGVENDDSTTNTSETEVLETWVVIRLQLKNMHC